MFKNHSKKEDFKSVEHNCQEATGAVSCKMSLEEVP